MLQKMIKFVKENLVAVIGIAAIALSLLLMLLPGQFADLLPSKNGDAQFYLNGYEFFFNTKTVNGTTYNPGVPGKDFVLPAGIIIFVLMTLTIVSFVFYKKSSALLLLAGLLEVVTSVFFFAMEANAKKYYQIFWSTTEQGKTVYQGSIQWVSYVCGALLVLAGAFAIYKAIMIMRDEIKHPQVQSKTPTYNYLKK